MHMVLFRQVRLLRASMVISKSTFSEGVLIKCLLIITIWTLYKLTTKPTVQNVRAGRSELGLLEKEKELAGAAVVLKFLRDV